jgi:hypothetical protein
MVIQGKVVITGVYPDGEPIFALPENLPEIPREPVKAEVS